MTERVIRVVVVDDQPLFATGMTMLIDAQRDLRCVGVAHDGAAAVSLVQRTRPDVVLMDLRMPGMNGLEATTAIMAEPDPPHVIVLTTIKRDEAAFLALRAGAVGLLTKDALPMEVLGAIRGAGDQDDLGDGTAAAVDVVREYAQPDRSTYSPREAFDTLTAREKDVFLRIARGLTNAEIAAETFLSETTVKSHARSILQKLGMRSRIDVVIFAYEHQHVTGVG